MRRWVRRHPFLVAAVAVIPVIAGYSWVASYRAWRGDLRAAGFVDEMSPPGSGDHVLVVAPHPDDETLGCGGLIQEAVARGAEVHVALMTNGDASELAVIFGERELPLSPQAFVALGRKRQQESLRALAALGVPEDHVYFLGFPNNGLLALWRPEHWPYSRLYRAPRTGVSLSPYELTVTPHAPYCGQQVLADLVSVLHQVQPNLVFVTHPQDLHPDHWTTCCFVRYALATVAARGGEWARHAAVYGYLIHWPRYPAPARAAAGFPLLPPSGLADHGDWVRLPLSPPVRQAKLRSIRAYRSQEPGLDRLLLRFARANESFERLSSTPMRIGGVRRWRDDNSHRRGLGGVEVTQLRLALTDARTAAAELTGSSRPIGQDAYIALDIRGWNDRGAPAITTIYEGVGGIVRALQVNESAAPALRVTRRQLGPGRVEIAPVPLPPGTAAGRNFLVTCWGSVRDRLTDPAVVSLVAPAAAGDAPAAGE